ncbi:MAG: ABC transporter permease [Anaerolineae bacterium]|jgi:ABC-type multidrug transport system permease subunit|nr:ABC transporter permease [Anaerolineae bacterium]
MRKILIIAAKDLRETFSDRNLLLIMFAAPLAIATIIALVFGGVSRGASPLQNIPIAIVNQDTGSAFVSYGQIFTEIFIPATPDPENELEQLVDAIALTDPVAARAGVDAGTYAVAIIIPPDFTSNLSYVGPGIPLGTSSIEMYADRDRPIGAEIIRSITDGILTQLAASNIALAAGLDTLIADSPLIAASAPFSDAFNNAMAATFTPSLNTIQVESLTIEQQARTFNPLVLVGSAQAIFFALFTANGGASHILEEGRNRTLHRLRMSPTHPVTILLGKMAGTFVMVFVQLVLLGIAFMLVNTLLAGQFELIWGPNPIALLLITFTITLASTGLGSIVAATAKNPERAQITGTVIAMFMGMVGGAFFQTGTDSAFGGIERLSIVYWGSNALQRLASGQSDIVLHAVVMTLFGAIAFAIGLWLFHRQLQED